MNKLVQHIIAKTVKGCNFNYKQAIIRNKQGKVKTPPLKYLLDYLKTIRISEAEIDQIVVDYWSAVEKNPKFEKEIAQQFKMKYSGKD